jgi:hypothetical protein
MPKWYAPCDPNCPEYLEYYSTLVGDPMTQAMGAPVDEIMEGFERRHRIKCKRCQEYGAANIDVEY